jgi:GNAT superfamily N-acetyltransferase
VPIRRATAAEAPAVAALVQRAYAPWVPVIGRRPAPMDDDYTAHVAAGEVFVLDRDGAIAAVLVLQDRPGHLWLDNVAVEPALQGQGLGRALLTFVEEEAWRRGLPEIRLLTHQRMDANIALYARAGYAETERRTEDGFDRVFMTRRMG